MPSGSNNDSHIPWQTGGADELEWAESVAWCTCAQSTWTELKGSHPSCRRPGSPCCYSSVTWSCPARCDPVDCGPQAPLVMPDSLRPRGLWPPGSSVREIFQARILQWVAISFSKGSSQPRDQTCIFCIAGELLYLPLIQIQCP